MPNNGSSSSGHVQWLCVHVEVCMQPFESAFMCVQCSLSHMKIVLMWDCRSRLEPWVCPAQHGQDIKEGLYNSFMSLTHLSVSLKPQCDRT